MQTALTAQLAQWLKFVETLPGKDQPVFLIALHWADTQRTQEALRTIATQDSSRATYAQKLLQVPVPVLDQLTNPSAEELDMCWGAFFATGDPVYVLSVMRCAVKPAKANVIDMSQQAARWSLKALCRTHAKVRDIKDTFYKTASPDERQVLDELFKN